MDGSVFRTCKGGNSNVVTCDEIEQAFFGKSDDRTKLLGRKENAASLATGANDMDEKCSKALARNEQVEIGDRPSYSGKWKEFPTPLHGASEAKNIPEWEEMQVKRDLQNPDDIKKRLEGQQRAEEREMVRRAARRSVIFGLLVSNPSETFQSRPKDNGQNSVSPVLAQAGLPSTASRRKCEAVMHGVIVEPSLAKGNWGIRWRE